jgi:hypothetical protein
MASSTGGDRKSGPLRKAGLTFVTTLGVLAIAPAISSASTVSISGAVITFQAAAAETNGITVTEAAGNYVFADGPGPDPTAGAGCADGGATVTCPLAAPTSVVVNLDDLGDTFTATTVTEDPFTINGEAGDDTALTGSNVADNISGGDGADTLSGDDGNDLMIGGAGNDNFNGNVGTDTVAYSASGPFADPCSEAPPTISVDADGATDDDAGCNSETGDEIETDVENVTGSTGVDTITGNASSNVLTGIGGDDTMNGGTGDDTLSGGDDNDTLNGDDDDDAITGGAGNDIINGGDTSDNSPGLSGGPGNDTIDGGAGGGGDIINGDAGNDLLLGGSDGADTLNGGDDNDRMRGGTLGDTFNGGNGLDRALYDVCSEVGPTITITIDGAANDAGCDAEATDNVGTTVESITGTTGADTITGSCQANTFAGSVGTASGHTDGGDTFIGDPAACLAATTDGTEADFFGGGEGGDTFDGDGTGNAGFDTVTFGSPYTGVTDLNIDWGGGLDDADGFGNLDDVQVDIERLVGNTGNDTIDATAAAQAVSLFGRAGTDTLTDSTFGDTMNGEGDADTYNCTNGGTDTIFQDGSDTVNGSC